MRFITKRKTTKELKNIKNPGRGFYHIYEFDLSGNVDFDELKWCLKEDESLALLAFNIGGFRSREIDNEAVALMQRVMDFFITNNKDLIVRFCYDRVGKGMESEPSTISMVKKHMQSIGRGMQPFLNHILVVQGLFVGNYGEMHGSKFLSDDNIVELYHELRQYTGTTYIALRTPAYLRLIDNKEYLTLYDDAIFGSDSDLGTFLQEEDFLYTEKNFADTVIGGEAISLCENRTDYTREEIIKHLEKLHITYLNRAHDINRIAYLKEIGAYDEIEARLGYLFRILDIKKSKNKIDIEVENIGFGPCVYKLMAVIGDGANELLRTNLGSEVWRSGQAKKISCQVEKSLKQENINVVFEIVETGQRIELI